MNILWFFSCFFSRVLLSLVVNSFRNADFDSIERFWDANLATQSGGICQAVGQIKHVQLFVCWLFRKLVVNFLAKNEVTSWACQGPLASPETVDLDVVVDDDVEQVVTFLPFSINFGAVRKHESYTDIFFPEKAGCLKGSMEGGNWQLGSGDGFRVSPQLRQDEWTPWRHSPWSECSHFQMRIKLL